MRTSVRKLLLTLAGAADYDQLKQKNAELTYEAYHDDLTGLANRLLFSKQSEALLKYSKEQNEPMTIMLIDLDNFKMINDTHGHLAGNTILIEIAKRLNAVALARCLLGTCLKKYAPHHKCHCTAARLGGDEFVMIFENMDKHEADIIAQQINQELKQPIVVNSIEVNTSASVGASIYPWNGETIHSLLKAADLAMYASKESGKDDYTFYERSMNTKIERRVEAELAVREIIRTNDTTLFYQPILDIETGKIVGAEALLRGKHLSNVFYDPVELITIAEDTNLIIPLGTIILKNACTFAKRCIDQFEHDENNCFVSVNVSATQMVNPDFAVLVKGILEETKLAPKHLILEITETMLMENFERCTTMLNELRAVGVLISIDDFGKGYSSFSYLQKLPIDKMKIDMSFIKTLGSDTKTNEIVKGILLMADALGLHTCAEGVENEIQYNKLKEFGCEQIQGYYKSKPLSEDDFIDVMLKE